MGEGDSRRYVVSVLSPWQAELLLALFESVARQEGWQPGGQIRAYREHSVYFAASVGEELAGGLHLVSGARTFFPSSRSGPNSACNGAKTWPTWPSSPSRRSSAPATICCGNSSSRCGAGAPTTTSPSCGRRFPSRTCLSTTGSAGTCALPDLSACTGENRATRAASVSGNWRTTLPGGREPRRRTGGRLEQAQETPAETGVIQGRGQRRGQRRGKGGSA